MPDRDADVFAELVERLEHTDADTDQRDSSSVASRTPPRQRAVALLLHARGGDAGSYFAMLDETRRNGAHIISVSMALGRVAGELLAQCPPDQLAARVLAMRASALEPRAPLTSAAAAAVIEHTAWRNTEVFAIGTLAELLGLWLNPPRGDVASATRLSAIDFLMAMTSGVNRVVDDHCRATGTDPRQLLEQLAWHVARRS